MVEIKDGKGVENLNINLLLRLASPAATSPTIQLGGVDVPWTHGNQLVILAITKGKMCLHHDILLLMGTPSTTYRPKIVSRIFPAVPAGC